MSSKQQESDSLSAARIRRRISARDAVASVNQILEEYATELDYALRQGEELKRTVESHKNDQQNLEEQIVLEIANDRNDKYQARTLDIEAKLAAKDHDLRVLSIDYAESEKMLTLTSIARDFYAKEAEKERIKIEELEAKILSLETAIVEKDLARKQLLDFQTAIRRIRDTIYSSHIVDQLDEALNKSKWSVSRDDKK